MLVSSDSLQGRGRASFSFIPSLVPSPHSCSEMWHSPIYFWISSLGSGILASAQGVLGKSSSHEKSESLNPERNQRPRLEQLSPNWVCSCIQHPWPQGVSPHWSFQVMETHLRSKERFLGRVWVPAAVLLVMWSWRTFHFTLDHCSMTRFEAISWGLSWGARSQDKWSFLKAREWKEEKTLVPADLVSCCVPAGLAIQTV